MISGNNVSDFNAFIRWLIATSESNEPRMYWLQDDVPTIGIGVALITRSNGTYTARSLQTLNSWFAGVRNWTATEQATLASIASDLNINNATHNETTARATFNSWGLRTTLVLTPQQGEQVFANVAQDLGAYGVRVHFHHPSL